MAAPPQSVTAHQPSPSPAFARTNDPSSSPATSSTQPFPQQQNGLYFPNGNGPNVGPSNPSQQNPYNNYQPGPHHMPYGNQPHPQQQQQHYSPHQQQLQNPSHQPPFQPHSRNSSGFRNQNQQSHPVQHGQQHQHNQSPQQSHHIPPVQHNLRQPYMAQYDPSIPPQPNHPNAYPRYPDQGQYWPGPYYAPMTQGYPQMGGPGPGSMQSGYAYGDYGRQGYMNGSYGGGFDAQADEANGATGPGPVSGNLGISGQEQPEGDYSSSHPDFYSQSGNAPPIAQGLYPGYYPPNHPYATGGGIGYSQYPPVPAYGYGYGEFPPQPILPPSQSGSSHQGNTPVKGLNPAAQGFNFVPSSQPPPPFNLPPQPIAAPPPQSTTSAPPSAPQPSASTAVSVAEPAPSPQSISTSQAPIFASIRRTSIPGPPPAQSSLASNNQQAGKFMPVVVDGEKLKGIGGRRGSSDSFNDDKIPPPAEPAAGQGLQLETTPLIDSIQSDYPSLSSSLVSTSTQPSAPASNLTVDSTPAMSTSATTPTSPKSPESVKTPRANDDPTSFSGIASSFATSDKDSAPVQESWQFVGPTMSGFSSPPSNATQPSLLQSFESLGIPSSSALTTTQSRAAGSNAATQPGTSAVAPGPSKRAAARAENHLTLSSGRPGADDAAGTVFSSRLRSFIPRDTKFEELGREAKREARMREKTRGSNRKALVGIGEGTRAGTLASRSGGKSVRFGEIDGEAQASDKTSIEHSQPSTQSFIQTGEVPSRSASVAPPAPQVETQEDSDPAKPSSEITPPAPVPKVKPSSWAAIFKPASSSASSQRSFSATPTASAGPSKPTSPTRSQPPLPPISGPPSSTSSSLLLPSSPPEPTTPKSSANQRLPSSSGLPSGSAPNTGGANNGAKRPTFNYAAAAAAGASLSPADELVKILSEGLPKGVSMAKQAGAGSVPRGLINTGNMCFANIILQTLAHCPPFADLLETLGQRLKADLSRRTPLLESMIIFLREFQPGNNVMGNSGTSTPRSDLIVVNGTMTPRGMQRAQTVPLNFQSSRLAEGRGLGREPFVPENVYDAMKENKRFDSLRRGFQEDAEEYLGFFLNTLHEELLNLLSRTHSRSASAPRLPNGHIDEREQSIERPVSPSAQIESDGWLEVGKKQKTQVVRSNETRETAITRMFGGTLRSILHAPGSKDSITLEPYQPLQLDISDPATLSITDALMHLSKPETVTTWSESRKENVNATKTVFVETWPTVLMLHLKRFVYEEGRVGKKGRAVAYGTELVVPSEIISPTKRSAGPVKYRLFGVVYHHGTTATGGHYTVAVSRRDDQGWLHFDDELVTPVTPDQVVVSQEEAEAGRAGSIGGREKCAYLLFYLRVRT